MDASGSDKRSRAATTIQRAFRAHQARKVETVSKAAYDAVRVYHGTHDVNAPGILQQGLRRQGGPGLSGLIGDATQSQGKVYYTKDKQQAAYYANTLASVAQYDRQERLNRAKDFDGYYDALQHPIRPRIVRAILPPLVQQNAQADPKGGPHDFTIPIDVPPRYVLPGHEQPNANISQRTHAVEVFRQELRQRGVQATTEQAARTLTRLRRNSIASDTAALNSQYAVQSADLHLQTHKVKNPPRFG